MDKLSDIPLNLRSLVSKRERPNSAPQFERPFDSAVETKMSSPRISNRVTARLAAVFAFTVSLIVVMSPTGSMAQKANDTAAAYSTWANGNNLGTGFDAWSLVSNNGGFFLQSANKNGASNSGVLDTSGKSFGMWGVNFADARRNFASEMAEGDQFTVQLSFQWDNGNKGFSLYTDTNYSTQVFNLNISSSGYSWTGGSKGMTSWPPRDKGVVINITITRTSNGFTWALSSPQDSGLTQSGTITSAAPRGFKFYVSGAGGDGGDLYFNNLRIDARPTVGSPTATSIGATSATLGGNVTANGGATLTSRGTVWGTSAAPTGNSLAEGGTTTGVFSHSRTGLTANTLYTYRAYAVNARGTSYSSDATFTTLPAAPTVGTGSNPTTSGFTANWTAPTMGSVAFTYTVEVDNDQNFGSIDATVNNISSASTSQAITSLAAGTTYYYRVRAVNSTGAGANSGTSAGISTTAAASPTITLSASTLSGALSATYPAASTARSFTVSGAALTGALTVQPSPANGNFEFSTSENGTYSSSLTLAPSSGTLSTTTVWVRLRTKAAAGTYNNADIQVSGGNATAQTIRTTSSGNTVTAKTLTITGATATGRAFNGLTTVTVSGGSLVGVESGDEVTLGGSPTGTMADANAGNNKPVTVSGYSISGTSATNYTVSQPTGLTVNISKATPTLTTAPTASAIFFGLAISNSTLTGGSASVAGGFAWTAPTTVHALGTSSYSVTFTPTDATNYNTFTTNVNLPTSLPSSRNTSGGAPQQPGTVLLGDTELTFGFDSWGRIGDNFGRPRLWVRFNNADVSGGTSTAYGGFVDTENKTITSGQFTQAGTWYWGIQMDYGSPYGTTYWYKSNKTGWSAMDTDGNGSTLTVTVSDLQNPTVSSTVGGNSQINLSHTRWSSRNVFIVRRAGSAVTWSPTQGQRYEDGENLGDGHVVVRRSLEADSFNDTGLDAGTTYHYKIYSENRSYYSSGTTTSATTLADFTYNTTTDATVSTVLSGSGSLTKSGNAELLLTGVNTYTGKTIINAGRLRIQADSGLGAVPGSVVADSITISNATLALDGSITLSSNRGITLTGNATIDDWGDGDTYNGIIATASGATTSLTKIGGGTTTFGGNSSYTGTTAINVGALTITHASALGAGGANNGTTVAANAALRLSNNISVSNELLTLNGTGVNNAGGALKSVSGTNSWSGNITVASNARIDADAGTLNISGNIAGTNNTLFIGENGNVAISGAISGTGRIQDGTVTSLFKSGPGTLTLSGANNYTGDTRISGGRVVVSAGGSLGDGSDVWIASNGALTVNANTTVATLREWGSTNGGTVVIGDGATLTVNGAGAGTFYQNSVSGAGGLTFAGTGNSRMQLYGAASYAGVTTVNSGTLGVQSGTTLSNTTEIRIAAGAGFSSLDNTVAPTSYTIASGKVLAGTSTTGTATVEVGTGATLTMASGSSLRFEASGSGTPSVGKISVTGNVALNNNNVTVNVSGAALPAGTYTLLDKTGTISGSPGSVTFTGPGAVGTGSVAVSNGSLVLTVAKATPTITTQPTASAITFGQTLASSTLSGGAASVPGEFAFTTSSTAPGVGTANQSVTFTPTDTANYNTVTFTVSVTVNQAALPAVTFTAPGSLTYSGTAKTYTASAGGAGLTLTYTGRNGTTYNNTTAPTNVGDYTVTATSSDGSYSGSQATNFSITAKTLTITGAAATNRAYNGSTTVAITGGTLSGVESADQATVTLGGSPTGTVETADVGTGKAVTVTGFSISGSAASNYSLTQPTGLTVNITQATPTIVTPPTASAIDLGQALNTSNLSGGAATGVGGASVGGSFAFTSPDTVPPVGTANQGVTFTPSDANYTTATTTVSVTVNSSVPVVTASTFSGTVGVAFNQSIIATGSPTSYAMIGTLPAGLIFNTANGAITGTPTAAVSGATVSVTATNNDGTSAAATITFNIAKGSSSIVVTGTTSFTYNGSPQGPNTSTVTGSTGAVTYSYSGSGYGPSATPPVNVGNYTVTATVAEDANYNGATSAAQTFAIAKAPLTITADSKVKAKGEADPSLTYTATGLVGGESLTGSLSRSAVNSISSPVSPANESASETPGVYPISLGSVTAGPNYEVTYVPANLVITGPIFRTVDMFKHAGSTTVTLGHASMMRTIQRVLADGSVASFTTGSLTITEVIAGTSVVPNSDPVANSVANGSAAVTLTVPANSTGDAFQIRVSDGTANTLVNISVAPRTMPELTLTPHSRVVEPTLEGAGHMKVTYRFIGRPNRNYSIEYATPSRVTASSNNGPSPWSRPQILVNGQLTEHSTINTGPNGMFDVTIVEPIPLAPQGMENLTDDFVSPWFRARISR